MNKFAAMDLLLWPAAPLTGPGIIFRATKQRRALVSISRGTETTKVQDIFFLRMNNGDKMTSLNL